MCLGKSLEKTGCAAGGCPAMPRRGRLTGRSKKSHFVKEICLYFVCNVLFFLIYQGITYLDAAAFTGRETKKVSIDEMFAVNSKKEDKNGRCLFDSQW